MCWEARRGRPVWFDRYTGRGVHGDDDSQTAHCLQAGSYRILLVDMGAESRTSTVWIPASGGPQAGESSRPTRALTMQTTRADINMTPSERRGQSRGGGTLKHMQIGEVMRLA